MFPKKFSSGAFYYSSRSVSTAIDRLKRPSRGGQNLTERHLRLERALKGKKSLTSDIESLRRPIALPKPPPNNSFRGMTIPEKPKPPEADECCMSGCAICVYDLYEDALSSYHLSLSTLRDSLIAMAVPESDWPEAISKEPKTRPLSAFEQLEKDLLAKQNSL
ncbi:oxidoreductase-like protein [Mycena floridula]|nr:oxidoreductase-like protein [Mycena floridula]